MRIGGIIKNTGYLLFSHRLPKFLESDIMVKTKASKYYAVFKGRKTGVFETWDECQRQVNGYDAIYRAFASRTEAESFVRTGLVSDQTKPSSATISDQKGTTLGKRKSSSIETDKEVVYCDGACRGNGKEGAVAGIGVWWGINDERSYRCPGAQTNNRAELMALVMVLLQAPMDGKPLIVKTDSQYTINCVTTWGPSWKNKGWVTGKGEQVKNRALIEYLLVLYDARRHWGHTVELEYVKGHSNILGNDGADKLAVAGAYLEEEPEWDFKVKMQEFQKVFKEMLVQRDSGKVERGYKKHKSSSPLPTTSVVSTQLTVAQASSSTSMASTGSSLDPTQYHSNEELLEYSSYLIDDDDCEIDLSD